MDILGLLTTKEDHLTRTRQAQAARADKQLLKEQHKRNLETSALSIKRKLVNEEKSVKDLTICELLILENLDGCEHYNWIIREEAEIEFRRRITE